MVNWAKSHGDNNIGILSDGTSFSDELATDAEADVKAAGLTFVKTITTRPPRRPDHPADPAKEAGIQTLFPTGFTGSRRWSRGSSRSAGHPRSSAGAA